MKEYNDFINKFLSDLETNVSCEIEVNNLNFEAEKELISHKKPIYLN